MDINDSGESDENRFKLYNNSTSFNLIDSLSDRL